MMRARAWVTLCAVVASIGSLTASCGSDEVTGNPGDISGGRGGSGGASGGRANTGGGGATASGGSSNQTSNLGKACASDASCGTTSGLTCINDPQIPQGLCSAACTEDADCAAFSKGAICNGGVCLEGCQVGTVTGLTDKCHGREDFGCRYVTAVSTTTACNDETDCGNGSICDQGSCVRAITACQPTCVSDDDCTGTGYGYCNLGTGLCQEEKPTGKPLGSDCDPNAATDECQGLCIGDSAGSFAFCSGFCAFGVLGGCGWNGTSGSADAACLFVPSYIQSLGALDVGYCGQLCDCNDDCRNPGSSCVSFAAIDGGQDFIEAYGRQGYCTTPQPDDVLLDQCDVTGGGGAGSGGEGGLGSTGEGGAGEGGVAATGGAGGASGGEQSGGEQSGGSEAVGGAAGAGGTGTVASGGAAGDTGDSGAPGTAGAGGATGG